MISVSGCAARLKEQPVIDEQFHMNNGLKYLEKKNYVKAIEHFQKIIESFPFSADIAKAHFMLAEAHFQNEEYITAAFEYEQVFTTYPSSSYAPQAQYKRAVSFATDSPRVQLDQANTILAIDEFNRFIDNYPRHELVEAAHKKIEDLRLKLAEKEYLSAQFYKKRKFYDSALIYYQYVIEQYPRTIWADHSRFDIAEVYYQQGKNKEARAIFTQLAEGDNPREIKERASRMLTVLDKKK
jgi:outer membrane protein assembly factor BamD